MADVKFSSYESKKITVKNTKGEEITSTFFNDSDKEVTLKDTDFKVSVRDGKEGAFLICVPKTVERISTATVNVGLQFSYLTRGKAMNENLAVDVALKTESERTAQYRK